MNKKLKIICRGGGDLATGIVYRLTRAGFPTLILETDRPAAIRRQVSFCEAVYEDGTSVEGIKAVLIHRTPKNPWEPARAMTREEMQRDLPMLQKELEACFLRKEVPVLIDPQGYSIELLKPDIVIDAILAKRNLGTRKDMAPLVIGVGPGFTAGEDVHLVVETMRGHNLARILTEGSALPDTKAPGTIAGYSKERVIHAEADGILRNMRHIGDLVEKDQEIARIYQKGKPAVSVKATIPGLIRGLIRDGYQVTKGFKIADIDPRISEAKNCFTISDKSRSIGGSVLEIVSACANGERYWENEI